MAPDVFAAILGTGMPVRCLIVDDHLPFSEAARELLTNQGVVVVGTATSAAEAIQRVQELRPDVALVDIDLGQDSGFDLARRLAADWSAVKVILISTHEEREFTKLIQSSPTAGFLAKTELSAENILRLLQQVEN
jgi:DNA-binding NarL/FixJ family response regulator